ncbi:MAG: dephospho-CoA kinase [Clostridiales bacterium]|nr:dephospho-CoA kinase [Clostridiales bacterium]
MEQKAFVLGITGNTGSGKSAVCRALRSLGAAVLDADAIAKELQQPGGAGLKGICQLFGTEYLMEDGTLNRPKLAKLVFGCEDQLKKLNGLMYPLIRDAIMERARGLKGLVVVDAPLLFDAGLNTICDAVWLVTAPEKVRKQRIMARDGLTDEQAEMRMANQRPIDAALVDTVIENDGEESVLAARVAELVAAL